MECLHADHQEAQQAEQRCTGWERGVSTCLPIKVWTVQGEGGNRGQTGTLLYSGKPSPRGMLPVDAKHPRPSWAPQRLLPL